MLTAQNVIQPQEIQIIFIPANTLAAQSKAITRQLRVAAYCRVSADQEEQLTSYEAQMAYYTEKIMKPKTSIRSKPTRKCSSPCWPVSPRRKDSMSQSIRWGKRQSFKSGKVTFQYKRMYGYVFCKYNFFVTIFKRFVKK